MTSKIQATEERERLKEQVLTTLLRDYRILRKDTEKSEGGHIFFKDELEKIRLKV